MPGPGIELVGPEEAAEVMEVLQSGYLSRYGPSDDPAFGAKVHRIEQEIATLTGVRYGLGLDGGGSAAQEVPMIDYRTLTDPDGDLATHLVVVLPSKEIAAKVAQEVGSRTLSGSGWHTYSKMNHLLEKRTVTGKGCPFDCGDPSHSHGDYRVRSLPHTDDLLERSMSIGIGVWDPNLAPFGLRMRDGPAEARKVGVTFRDAMIKHRA